MSDWRTIPCGRRVALVTAILSAFALMPAASAGAVCSPASGGATGSASGGGFPYIGPPPATDHYVAHGTACDTTSGVKVQAFVSVFGLSGYGAGYYATALSSGGYGKSPQTATLSGYLYAGTYQLFVKGSLMAPSGKVWPSVPAGCSRDSARTILTCVERTNFTIG